MGAACCTAAKDRTVTSGSPIETVVRHARYSPSWSFRWDSRGRVAGEDIPVNWSHGGSYGNDHGEVKSATTVETVFASEEGSPLDSFQSLTWQKSPPPEGHCITLRLPPPDQAVAQEVIESNVQVKGSTDSPCVSYPSPVKLSPSVLSFSSSPLSSQSLLIPPNSTPSRLHHRSPGRRLLLQLSDSRIREYKSPTFSISEDPSLILTPAWGNESNRGSNGGSSDSWSIPAFSELMSNHRESWSFDSDASGFNRDKFPRFIGRSSRSPSFDLQTCGICTKRLTEKSSWQWSSQKINNEIAVVSVLTCGHVYHAECLEYMTPEVNKYDPACPVCTFGEKRAAMMSEKALKAELDTKGRKRSRKRIVDIDLFNHLKNQAEERNPRVSSSSTGKPFMRRHFSFVSRASKSTGEIPRKGFFWTRSSKK